MKYILRHTKKGTVLQGAHGPLVFDDQEPGSWPSDQGFQAMIQDSLEPDQRYQDHWHFEPTESS